MTDLMDDDIPLEQRRYRDQSDHSRGSDIVTDTKDAFLIAIERTSAPLIVLTCKVVVRQEEMSNAEMRCQTKLSP